MPGGYEGGKALQERTNLPSYVPSQNSKGGVAKQPPRDANAQTNATVTPVAQKNSIVMMMDSTTTEPSSAMPRALDASPDSSYSDTRTAIELLQAAINILKAHAEDAGSNIEQLRVLLAHRTATGTEEEYKSLQRRRFLEERRELDAHRSLWSTAQKVSAILRGDEEMFESQRLADRSLGLFDTRERVVATKAESGKGKGEKVSATPISDAFAQAKVYKGQGRLVPLALAVKADYIPRRLSFHEELELQDDFDQPSSSPTPFPSTEYDDPGPLDLDELGALPYKAPPNPAMRPLHASISGRSRGTAAIIRQNSTAQRQSEVLLAQRIKDVQKTVTIPDYVGDLLSEFESTVSSSPLLPLSSSEKKNAHVTLPTIPEGSGRPAGKLGHKPSALSLQLSQSPSKLKRKVSRNRFSEIFVSGSQKRAAAAGSSSPSKSAGVLSPSLPPLLLEDDMSLSNPLLTPASNALFRPPSSLLSSSSVLSTASVTPTTAASPQGQLQPPKSANSLSARSEDMLDASPNTNVKRFSASSVLSLVTSSSTHDASQQKHARASVDSGPGRKSEKDGKEKEGGMASKLRKRISKLRG